MALLTVNFFSQSLGMATAMNVILPEKRLALAEAREAAIQIDPKFVNPEGTRLDCWDGESPLAVLYLLHGASDDHTVWLRRTSIERYVEGKRLAVVMPAAGISYYSDEANGYPYWQFIGEELPEVVKAFFKISGRREDTYAAGLSMGSFGAAKLALNYPDRYCKAALLSGGIYLGERITATEDRSRRILGDEAVLPGSANDLPGLACTVAASGRAKPAFFTACGTNDFLYPFHRRSVAGLTALGYDVTNYEEPGAYHEWSFWDKTIPMALEWMDIG